MTSADLNQDGHGDLVVGAPGYSRPGHIHVGRVYLLYGNNMGLPPIDLDLDKEAHGVLEGFQVRRSFRILVLTSHCSYFGANLQMINQYKNNESHSQSPILCSTFQ